MTPGQGTPSPGISGDSVLKKVLVLTPEELKAFDPLTKLAALVMIKNGSALLDDQGGG